MARRFVLSVAGVACWLATGSGVMAGEPGADPFAMGGASALTDDELAEQTGKFLLPNGVELALSVVSDTLVNGQFVLRTVLTVDKSAEIQVFGRDPAAGPDSISVVHGEMPGGVVPSGVNIALDRKSGIQTVTPTFSVSMPSAPVVTLAQVAQDAEAQGLVKLPVVPGGPAVATADGVVTMNTVANGTQVTLVSDQTTISHLVGQSVATALANSADNRTFDTVTNVAIDLRNAAPFQVGSAGMRIDTLALDATRGMLR